MHQCPHGWIIDGTCHESHAPGIVYALGLRKHEIKLVPLVQRGGASFRLPLNWYFVLTARVPDTSVGGRL